MRLIPLCLERGMGEPRQNLRGKGLPGIKGVSGPTGTCPDWGGLGGGFAKGPGKEDHAGGVVEL